MIGTCYLCGRYGPVEMHHCFPASRKRASENYGAVVPLCHACHNEPPDGVHFNRERRLALQRDLQKKIMERYGMSEDRFRVIFGKSYLNEEE